MKPILRDLIATNKSRYKLGTYFSLSAEKDNYISLLKMSGNGISYLKIDGSESDGVALNDSGLEIRICKKNLIDENELAKTILALDPNATLIEKEGRRCIKYRNFATYQKDLTSCCPEFKANTRYIFSVEAKPYIIMSEAQQYDGGFQITFKPTANSVSTPYSLSAKTTTEFTRIYTISKIGTTVDDINLTWGSQWNWLLDLDAVYLYEYDGNTNPEYEAPHIEKAILPSVIALDGEEIPVRLTEGESLLFDGVRVKYITLDKEYDLTATDFGKALANIRGAYNEDFTFMVKAPLKPSAIKVGYYSTEYSDTATLRVKYLCDGVEIMQAKEYLTRKNGAFTVIAPSIEGYLPQKRQISGVINGDTEISIEYRGKK